MALEDMIEGEVPADTLTEAQNDAVIIISKSYANCLPSSGAVYDLAVKYYSAHLLYAWGFATPVISSSVGDVSISKGNPMNMGDKVGASPYFFEFQKLLDCPDGSGDFLYSV